MDNELFPNFPKKEIIKKLMEKDAENFVQKECTKKVKEI